MTFEKRMATISQLPSRRKMDNVHVGQESAGSANRTAGAVREILQGLKTRQLVSGSEFAIYHTALINQFWCASSGQP